MEIRSFLAFELPLDIKRTVRDVSGALRKTPLNVRWVNVYNIHLTVVFMGNIPEADVAPMGNSVKKVCRDYGPFEIYLNGIGFFPGSRNARVLWIGLDGDMERMAQFRDALQACLVPFGIRKEKRPFKPHLTLGRFRKPGKNSRQLEAVATQYHDLKSPVQRLDELIMFKSELKPSGAEYSRLAAWPLVGKTEVGGRMTDDGRTNDQ
ncbi:MAG: RNA 2',3'-cyclic phosphodiesterase [Deltaproteobacteria bacterium]|nr:RNA 2',3'-cyclic phosphodiesterase [Deltaproteobacteria bacterium]